MRLTVTLPVLAKDIGQLGARSFSPAASFDRASDIAAPD